jgi:hypothetical protein
MATEGRNKAILAALLSAAFITAAGPSIAADKPEPGKPAMGMHGSQGMGGMEGMSGMEGMGGMMEMMDMMGSCSRMHGGSMADRLPQLPPGNAKLQLEMQAEMMQKMGEILGKYAAQIREEKK